MLFSRRRKKEGKRSTDALGAGRDLSIVIIGAGFGGIGAAVKLQEAGFNQVTILEKSDGIGGTWWENRYPGAEVDTPSVLYSYSFRSHDWTRTHVRQAELQDYLSRVVDERGLRPTIELNVKVDEVVWRKDAPGYLVRTNCGRTFEADVVISAVGLLNEPNLPSWPGLGSFKGPAFHTARWEHQHDLAGKTVAVVGSGSSAVQIVPELADIAGKTLMFQREPGWIIPKGDRALTAEERVALRRKITWRLKRLKLFVNREMRQFNAQQRRPGSKKNLAAQCACVARINRILAGRPDLIEAVTPRYPYGGKRQVVSDSFYPSLLKPNVILIPHAVTAVTENGVVDARGIEHQADVLVLATGFKPAQFLSNYQVIGPRGRSIHDVWNGEPNAFLGMMVHGFPNFFMIYGPNTNGGAIVTHIEMQAKYIVAVLKKLKRRKARTVQVRESFQTIFNDILQKRMKGTAWEIANNYFKSASGRIVTQWPDGALTYGLCTKLLRGMPWEFGYGSGRDNR